MRRPPVSTRAGGPPRGAPISPAMPPRLCASNSSGLRCTRSASGSRTFSMPTILSAKAWITEISRPRRKSFTSAASDLLSLSTVSVRTRERLQALQQRRRRFRLAQHLDRRAGGGERVARQVDAVEVAKILGAVLQMVVDLQAGAQRVGGGPGRGALAVNVEHEAADRHRRVAAIVDHVVPVLVTQLGDVHPERDQHVERVARRHRARGERVAQADRLLLGVALAEQLRFEQVEQPKLFVRRQRRVIGDVVGRPDEIVEAENQRPVTRMNDPRRDRKILVTVGLSGSQFARAGHQKAGYIGPNGGTRRYQAHATDREPHIGEYAAKTNAIWGHRPMPPRPANDAGNGPCATVNRCGRGLLPVAFQHLVAGRRDLRTILLQAGQDGEIALIDHRAAEALHVTGASLLLLRRSAALLLGEGIR